MGTSFCFDWEIRLIVWFQERIGSGALNILKIASYFGEDLVIIFFLGFLYWCYNKEEAKRIGLSVVIGIVLNSMIKNLVLRRRPYVDYENVKCLRPVVKDSDIYDMAIQGYSFPSGHAVNSTLVFGSFPFWMKHKGIALISALLIPFIVGVSRFILGVHFPTDVLAGWALGIGILLVTSFLQKKVKSRGRLHLIVFLLSLTGLIFCRSNDYYTGLGVMAGFFLAIPFEERFVNFENTRVWWRILLRLLMGGVFYFGLDILLKLPFPRSFLDSGSMAALFVRLFRYFIVTFLMLGVYPMLFRLGKKKGNLRSEAGEQNG